MPMKTKPAKEFNNNTHSSASTPKGERQCTTKKYAVRLRKTIEKMKIQKSD